MSDTKTLERIERIIGEHKEELRRKYGVSEIGVFGSYVRGEQKTGSDLDILVRFDRPIGLLKFIELENRLNDILGVKVDLVMKDALKPRISRHILEEVVAL